MNPEARELLAGERFRLRDLILVVRKDQIDAAGMDVERCAEVLNGHHGALDVPAGTARADFGIPRGFAGFWRFPEGEVAGVVLLVFVNVDARARNHLGEIVVRELAVGREGADPEIDRAVAAVGVAALFELVDGGGHFGDVLCGAGDALGAFEAERGAVVEECLSIGVGVFFERFALCDGVANDFVVDIRDVHDVVERKARRAQPAPQEIVEDEGPEVADVREVVDGGTAGVHLDGLAFQRFERLHLLGERVVEAHGTLKGNFYGNRGVRAGIGPGGCAIGSMCIHRAY